MEIAYAILLLVLAFASMNILVILLIAAAMIICWLT